MPRKEDRRLPTKSEYYRNGRMSSPEVMGMGNTTEGLGWRAKEEVDQRAQHLNTTLPAVGQAPVAPT